MSDTILLMKDITKIYGNGVIANKEVTFSVEEGEIHALMGENGAGKSTLMKILFGIEEKDSGEIIFCNQKLDNLKPIDIIKSGIGMVHQHFMLVDSLRVYENVILGMEPKKRFLTDKKKAIALVQKLSETYNLNVDPLAKVEDLSVGLKQKVEIIKVLARKAKLLILDEPTAVLTPQETSELFEQLMLLKKSGHTIIFISHKIKEVKQICNRITVLRKGKLVGTMDAKEATEEEISKFMVGRDVILKVEKTKAKFASDLLKVSNLSFTNQHNKKMVDNVSFNLKAGQILGVAGVEGNGQNELAECIVGFHKNVEGKVNFKGEEITNDSILKIRTMGMSYIPEDRIAAGVATKATIWENLVVDRIEQKEVRTNRLLSHKKIHKIAEKLIGEFQILAKNDTQEVGMLSGGNMQKVVVAREFSAKPDLLIANQPTRGIDVGANEFIWKKIVELRDEGKAILLISADLNEILELSDSIMVMYEGKIAGYFEDSKKVNEYELGLHMLGLMNHGKEGAKE